MAKTALNMSLDEVKKLASSSEESTSNIKRTEGIITVSLHPMYAANISKGVADELNDMSSRYSKELGGIPIAYEKVRVSPNGGLLHTSPYMYFRVQATFYIFSPEVGSVLEGTIKKKSPHHLSCLIHGLFNVSVPRPHDVQMKDWEGASLEEGDVIRITITNIDMSFYLPMITGHLESVVSKAVPDIFEEEMFSTIEEEDYSENKLQHTSADSGISGSEDEKTEVTVEEKLKQSDEIQNVACQVNKKSGKDKSKKKKNKKAGEVNDKVLEDHVKKKKKSRDSDIPTVKGDMKKKKKNRNSDIPSVEDDVKKKKKNRDSAISTVKKETKKEDGDRGKNVKTDKKKKIKKKKLKLKADADELGDLSLSSEFESAGLSGYDRLDGKNIGDIVLNEENVDRATIKEKITKEKKGKRKKGVSERLFTTADGKTELDYPFDPAIVKKNLKKSKEISEEQFSDKNNETTGSRKSKKRKLEESPDNHKKKRKVSGTFP